MIHSVAIDWAVRVIYPTSLSHYMKCWAVDILRATTPIRPRHCSRPAWSRNDAPSNFMTEAADVCVRTDAASGLIREMQVHVAVNAATYARPVDAPL